MNKLLVDTNILIYSIDEASKYFQRSQKLFTKQLELYTTSKNLSEFLSVTTRLPQKSLSLEDALIVLEDFTNAMKILYPDEESLNLIHINILFLVKHIFTPKGFNITDRDMVPVLN